MVAVAGRDGRERPPSISLPLGSTNGERRAEPPRPKSRRLPAVLRHERREFQEALLDADGYEDLPGKWRAAILKAEENAPNLRIVGAD
jgi:hypothetical protein